MKKNNIRMMFLGFSSLLISASPLSHAIVDYSDNSDSSSGRPQSKASAPSAGKDSKSGLVWKSDISVDLNYEILNINSNKIGLLNVGTHLQTPFNVYFDLNYWQAKDNSQNSSGNPKFILGFNWLRFGSAADMASINFYGGARLKSSSSLGSSRTDKIFGVETTKKFGSFGLGIGYDMTLTGEPTKTTDMAIGNIHRIEVSTGWMATNDIQFEVSVENFRVKSSSSSAANHLTSDLSFSTISPKLNLQIFSNTNFELGARYRMQKAVSSQDLLTAKLIDHHGAYTNSVFSGLNISI